MLNQIRYKIYRINEIISTIFFRILPKFLSLHFINMIANNRGYYIQAWRYGSYKRVLKRCGKSLRISCYVIISNPERLEIGDNVTINPFCFISAYGNLSIGNNVLIGHRTSILTTDHIIKINQLTRNTGLISQPVIIKNNVFIGANVTILKGITVNSGSVLAAGSVATHDVPQDVVVAGMPATIIKNID